ncbi:MAG: hypothetical protein R2726_06820 [Acidimicrobiales bacterium]
MELPISRPTDSFATTTPWPPHEPEVPHPEVPGHGIPGVEDLEVAAALGLQVDPAARFDVLVRHGRCDEALDAAASRRSWRPSRLATTVLVESLADAVVAAARVGDYQTVAAVMAKWRAGRIGRRRWVVVGETVTDELMPWVHRAAEDGELVTAVDILAAMPALDSTAARRHDAWTEIRQPISTETAVDAYRCAKGPREQDWVSMLVKGDSPDLSKPTGAAQGVRESGAYGRLLDRLDAVPGLRVVQVPWDRRAHRYALVENGTT